MAKHDWASLPRSSKIAAAMWPDLLDEGMKRQMVQANPGMKGRVPVSEPTPDRGRYKVPLTADNLSRVPHLVKRR